MNKGLYRKLAQQNIVTNKNTFLPFGLCSTTMIAMFYMLYSIGLHANEELFFGAKTIRSILYFGVIVCGIFSVFVLFYTNSFLVKRRSKEFGLYNILGMEKKHIAKVVFWEIAIIGVGSIVAGLFSGMLFSRLMFMILLNIMQLDSNFSFHIMPRALVVTAIIYVLVFVLISIVNTIRVIRLKPVDLLQGGRVGEREPKTKWVKAVGGCVCLVIGYYLALSTSNPITAMSTFFVAVLFVIAGTYLLFIAGSVALLKILKKNKKYYYHRKHFVTVSGLIYRMKQNAVGLANICILSTAVIVVLSTTVSLYVGIENLLVTRYPKEVITSYSYMKDVEPEDSSIHYDYDKLEQDLKERADKYNLEMQDIVKYYYYFSVGRWQDNVYTAQYEDLTSMVMFEANILEDYNNLLNTNVSLSEDEILIVTENCDKPTADEVIIAGKKFKVKEGTYKMPNMDNITSSYGIMYIVVKDFDALLEVRDVVNGSKKEEKSTTAGVSVEVNTSSAIEYDYEFNLSGSTKDKQAFCTGLRNYIENTGIAHTSLVENRLTARQDFFEMYGSLFFIGIFIGGLFLITTVMIIYYKQIFEGYEDREKFVIMQKVGLSRSEAKSIIKNQVLLVFFFPITMAVVHICFAFDIIKKILEMLNLTDVKLFVGCTVGTVAVFMVVYAVVYALTARTYYQITR